MKRLTAKTVPVDGLAVSGVSRSQRRRLSTRRYVRNEILLLELPPLPLEMLVEMIPMMMSSVVNHNIIICNNNILGLKETS
jgi:hypothetical protein